MIFMFLDMVDDKKWHWLKTKSVHRELATVSIQHLPSKCVKTLDLGTGFHKIY